MHRGLLALVTLMSLMIVACLGLLVYGLMTKTGGKNALETALALPKSATVRHMAGYDGNLALYVSEGQKEYIYLLDPKNGKKKGRIAVVKEAR